MPLYILETDWVSKFIVFNFIAEVFNSETNCFT